VRHPRAEHAVGDPELARERRDQVGRPAELDQLVGAAALVVDVEGQRPLAPVALREDLAPARRDRRLRVGVDLRAAEITSIRS